MRLSICLLGMGDSPRRFNIPAATLGDVDCLRLWCLTVSCSSAREDVAAQPLETVLVMVALLLLLVLSRRSRTRWCPLLAMPLVLVVMPIGHALWRTVWMPCAAVCEDNDSQCHDVCESSRLPPLLQLKRRATPSQDAAGWMRTALAVLDMQPEVHENDCVVKQLKCGNSAPSVPSVVYPSLNAIYEDACVALDAIASASQSAVFAPTERMASRSARCRAEPGNLIEQPIATCRPMATAMLFPCEDWRTIQSPRTRFCRPPLSTRPLRGSLVDPVPLLFVEQPEAATHPGNIGHFFRDVSFVASMLHKAQREGSVVYAPKPPERRGTEVLGPWQQGLVAAIWRPGGVQRADSLLDAFRKATPAQHRGHANNSSSKSGLSGGGVHFCGRRVQRFSNAFGVAHAHTAMEELTNRVHAHCSTSSDHERKNATTAHSPRGRRTLLLSVRSGPDRLISNVEEALGLMRHTAHALGLEARVVNFGRLSFCEQAMQAAAAQVLIGAHGADLANAFLMPSDATLVEAVPKLAGDRGIWHTTTSIPPYGQQMAALGRRYLSVRLFDVDNASYCGSYSAWMYGSCSARISPNRLNATLAIVYRLYRDADGHNVGRRNA